MSLSQDWFESRCDNYRKSWSFVRGYKTTPLEGNVLNAQSEESQGIMPKEVGGVLEVHFRLYGEHDVVTLNKKK
jgi:hypothetical protein